MKISCIQMDISFGSPERNFEKAETLIERASKDKPDIIVLPELWTTGYDLTRLEEIGDRNAESSIQFLQTMAQKHNAAFIGGSVANKTADGVFNTLLAVSSTGELVHQYSKLHLFKLMDEHLHLSPGSGDASFKLDGHSLAGFICYDIRFPEWIRKHALEGAEAIFAVAEWPMPRLAHWRALLIARAIENQCFVVACNRAGSDPSNQFAGHSIIIDPWGEVVAEASEHEEILSAEIDLRLVEEVRGRIPVFTDRRPEFY
ncbi:carbon-nitrogen family hydrolase [Bacillus infantis]|uniref:carbon-nitrogen family hydrolase n=1 Tax=Bacillus infantis TaxID=324767 RepID=UPI001CD7C029|nr:carbon-nitrogen family hydrolase [Bacillus infantis]MCA1039674.1 carbon-nitrogen family hydrolase [Bacillus infantis]